jgi:hypothetical protein
MRDLKPGDIVRVKDPKDFISDFAKQIANRDAIVNWVGPDQYGQFRGFASVTFQKRNGRGKEFTERMRISDLELAAAASTENGQRWSGA